MKTSASVPHFIRMLPVVAAALALAACNKTETTPSSSVAAASAPLAASAASGAGAETVARVNGDTISGAQLDMALRRRHAMRTGEADGPSRAALEGVIDQQLEMQQAIKLKIDQTPEVQQTLEMIRRELLAQAYMRHVAEDLPKPSDETVKAFFDSHAALYGEHKTYDFQRYEVMAPPDKHDAVVAKAGTAKSAAELEAWFKSQNIKFQKSPLKLESEQLQSTTGEKLRALQPGHAMGQPSGPAVAVFVLEKVTPTPKTLADVRSQIEQQVGMEARRTALTNAAKDLRKDAKVEYEGKYAQPAASEPAMGGSGAAANLAPAPAPAPAASH